MISDTTMAVSSEYRLIRSHNQRSTSTDPMPAPNSSEMNQAVWIEPRLAMMTMAISRISTLDSRATSTSSLSFGLRLSSFGATTPP